MKLFFAALFLIGIPGYYITRYLRKTKREKKQLELGLVYDKLVKQGRLSVGHAELLNGKLIMLDRRNKQLLIIDHNQAERQEECIPLLGIETCRVVEVKQDADGHIKKIFLELKYKRNNKTVRFCFYDDSYDLITELPSLARKAKFWKHRVDLHKYPGSVGLQLEYVL
jgi:hypothetical protein